MTTSTSPHRSQSQDIRDAPSLELDVRLLASRHDEGQLPVAAQQPLFSADVPSSQVRGAVVGARVTPPPAVSTQRFRPELQPQVSSPRHADSPHV